jgi:hypothetical protein
MDTTAIINDLSTSMSRADSKNALQGVTKAQLADVVKQVDLVLTKGLSWQNKSDLIDRIVSATIGTRAKSAVFATEKGPKFGV